MKPTLRQYAIYFSLGLEFEIFSISEVSTGMTQLIENWDQPLESIIPSSEVADKSPLELINLLSTWPFSKDLDVPVRLLFAKLGELYPTLLPEQGQFAPGRFAQVKHIRIFNKLRLYTSRLRGSDSKDIQDKILQIWSDIDRVACGADNWSIIQRDYEELLDLGKPYQEWLPF